MPDLTRRIHPEVVSICARACSTAQGQDIIISRRSANLHRQDPSDERWVGWRKFRCGDHSAGNSSTICDKKLDLTRHHLESLGLELGADVPVFVHGRNAFAVRTFLHWSHLCPCQMSLICHSLVAYRWSSPTAQVFSYQGLRRDTVHRLSLV